MDHNGGQAVTARSAEWRNLVADVEDLIKKIANVDDAEIARVRAKVERTIESAKTAAMESTAGIREYARDATHATDEYVHESPWTAVGVAAAFGAAIGFLLARR
jgi:ElaB/YqjD/DUF883 family membrane-anchored ribosome-binding protein